MSFDVRTIDMDNARSEEIRKSVPKTIFDLSKAFYDSGAFEGVPFNCWIEKVTSAGSGLTFDIKMSEESQIF